MHKRSSGLIGGLKKYDELKCRTYSSQEKEKSPGIVLHDHCLEVSETFFYLSYITGAEGVAVVSVLARITIV